MNVLIFSAQEPSLSDVLRRQILTYKGGPCAERVKPQSATILVGNLSYQSAKSLVFKMMTFGIKICKG